MKLHRLVANMPGIKTERGVKKLIKRIAGKNYKIANYMKIYTPEHRGAHICMRDGTIWVNDYSMYMQ